MDALREGEKVVAYRYLCPGCGIGHIVTVQPCRYGPLIWEFNHNTVYPTFYPSIRVTWPSWNKGEKEDKLCHHFIKNGMIEFLEDCTHELAGQTVRMKMRDD